ncbi:MAG: MBOAT family O-acyltransferase [Methanosarcina sp.]
MIFTSFIYLIFIGIVAVVYYLIPVKNRWKLILLASIAYYISFIPLFILPLAALVAANYFLARMMGAKEGRQKLLLFLAIVFINVFILCFFKYFSNIFPENQVNLYRVNIFFKTDPVDRIILPLGFSYIVFTALAYQIEIKRNNIRPEANAGIFSLYLLFFPKVAQGPVERPMNLIKQFSQTHEFDYDMVVNGLKTILVGYFKKLVVADRLAVYVSAVYGNSDQHNGTSLFVATVFFAFQIYADFSGYTDIAIGSAKIFGINLTDNFRQPYLATSIKDFWDRWHITFSTWLRDYIFTPVAIWLSSVMPKETYLKVSSGKWVYLFSSMVTFTLCGMWHGVGWTYLLWGSLFGVYLTYHNWTAKFNKRIRKRLGINMHSRSYTFLRITTTFFLVLICWIIFRAQSVDQAMQIMKSILISHGSIFYEKSSDLIFSVMGISALIAIDLKREYFNSRVSVFYNRFLPVRMAGIVFIVITVLLSGVFDGSQFIYFQF